MGWMCLILAIIFEVGGTLSMKNAAGFSKLWPSVSVFACYGTCLAALTFAMERIEMSVVYAVWSGLGTALIACIGIVLYQERFDWMKAASVALIILGVVGLNLSAGRTTP